MSVLIKGMEMPKSCDVCFMRDACEYSMPLGKRLTECPLIEIPPHGRLIDADVPIPLVDTHGKKIEVTVAHIIENNLGIVNAIIESEEKDDKNI